MGMERITEIWDGMVVAKCRKSLYASRPFPEGL